MTCRVDRWVMRVKLEPESHVLRRPDHLGDELGNDVYKLGLVLTEQSSDETKDVSFVKLLDDLPVLAQVF